MSATHLFVYGTLLRGFHHPLHDLIESHGRFAGEARVRGKLYDLGAYPGMIPSEGDELVIGEVYELTKDRDRVMATLDEYEGCDPDEPEPHEYRRTIVEARLASGERVEAWAYVLNRNATALRRIESGSWRA